MIVIRKEILKKFETNAIDKFKTDLINNIKSTSSNTKITLTDQDFFNMIDYGIQRAKSYEIVDQFGVTKYVKLMLMFGLNFDIDPRFPWVKATLNPEKKRHALFRINDTYAKGVSIAQLKPQLLAKQSNLMEEYNEQI